MIYHGISILCLWLLLIDCGICTGACQTLPYGCPQITVILAATFVYNIINRAVTVRRGYVIRRAASRPASSIIIDSQYFSSEDQAIDYMLCTSFKMKLYWSVLLSLVFVGLAAAGPHALQGQLSRFLGEGVCIQYQYCISYSLE